MTKNVGKPARRPRGGEHKRLASAASAGSPDEAETLENAFTESGSVTLASILHLLRLMGSELVLMRGLDIAKFEQAVRARIDQFDSPTTDQHARDAGLANARYLVEQVLTQIRAQAALKKSLTVVKPAAPGDQTPTPLEPRLLN